MGYAIRLTRFFIRLLIKKAQAWFDPHTRFRAEFPGPKPPFPRKSASSAKFQEKPLYFRLRRSEYKSFVSGDEMSKTEGSNGIFPLSRKEGRTAAANGAAVGRSASVTLSSYFGCPVMSRKKYVQPVIPLRAPVRPRSGRAARRLAKTVPMRLQYVGINGK